MQPAETAIKREGERVFAPMHDALFGQQSPDQGKGAVTLVVGRWQSRGRSSALCRALIMAQVNAGWSRRFLACWQRNFQAKNRLKSGISRPISRAVRPRRFRACPAAAVPRRAHGRRWCRGPRTAGANRASSGCARHRPPAPPDRPARRPAISTGKSRPACAPHRVDHLEHRRAATVAAVERRAGAAAAQIGERRRMRAREIADMDVVADAGAVRRRIVGAEDVDLGPLAERRFAGDLDQMGRGRRRLPGAQLRIGAGDVEVAQHHEAQAHAPCRHRAA